jgi:hypothetical protein
MLLGSIISGVETPVVTLRFWVATMASVLGELATAAEARSIGESIRPAIRRLRIDFYSR